MSAWPDDRNATSYQLPELFYLSSNLSEEQEEEKSSFFFEDAQRAT